MVNRHTTLGAKNSIAASESAVASTRDSGTNFGSQSYFCQKLTLLIPRLRLITVKKIEIEINGDNLLGFGGLLAIAIADIFRQLWSGQRDSSNRVI